MKEIVYIHPCMQIHASIHMSLRYINLSFISLDLEADLQEVWSVRKNIHHNGATKHTGNTTSSSLPSVQVKAGQYSRHGAIPAQQTQGPSQNKGITSSFVFAASLYILGSHYSISMFPCLWFVFS